MGFFNYSHPFDDYDSDGDFFLFLYFHRNKKIMDSHSSVPKDAKDTGPYYISDE